MPAYKDLGFPTTRETALERAYRFAPHMGGEYAKNRNEVVSGHPFVSRLAPAIRVRLISESEVAHIALREFPDLGQCEKFIQEIYWRSYWRSWLELRPSIWNQYRQGLEVARYHIDKNSQQRVQALERGESGVFPIDEFARELVATGYLHNHARMWFAAYWIHIERLPWELGADFFERHLVCACPASNTLSWRWVAGIQTPGKPYLARRSNLERYCDSGYLGDSSGMNFLENQTPLHLPSEPQIEPLTPQFDIQLSQPKGRVGLWITEDDLAPETSSLKTAKIAAICTSVTGAPSPSDTSNGKRHDYRLLAAQDAGQRAQTHWGSEAHHLTAHNGDDLTQQLIAWSKHQKLDTIVALKPFIGPTSDALPQAQAQLRTENIELKLLRRSEDANQLPFAKRGYFHFWQMCKKHEFAKL